MIRLTVEADPGSPEPVARFQEQSDACECLEKYKESLPSSDQIEDESAWPCPDLLQLLGELSATLEATKCDNTRLTFPLAALKRSIKDEIENRNCEGSVPDVPPACGSEGSSDGKDKPPEEEEGSQTPSEEAEPPVSDCGWPPTEQNKRRLESQAEAMMEDIMPSLEAEFDNPQQVADDVINSVLSKMEAEWPSCPDWTINRKSAFETLEIRLRDKLNQRIEGDPVDQGEDKPSGGCPFPLDPENVALLESVVADVITRERGRLEQALPSRAEVRDVSNQIKARMSRYIRSLERCHYASEQAAIDDIEQRTQTRIDSAIDEHVT